MPKSTKATTKSKPAASESSEEENNTPSTPKTPAKTTKSTGGSPAVVYRYNDIKFANIDVSEMNKTGRQPLAYINYTDPIKGETKILIQSDKIKLTSHGIPQLDKEGAVDGFYEDDTKREFIKIPLDDSQPSCVALRQHLKKADEFFGSDKLRKQLFGNRAKDYEYQPCIKTPQSKPSEDDDKKSKSKSKEDDKPKPVIDYVKMKFNMVYVGDGKNKQHINKTKLKRVGKEKKENVIAETITDVANEIKWNSEIKFIFYYNKVWANKTPASGAKVITYGLGFKIMAIEYTPSVGKGIVGDNIEFLSESEETPKTTSSKKVQKLDDEEEEQEEEEPEPPKKKSKSTKKGKDEEEEEAEEEAEEEEAEEEEEEEPKKKPSKNSKKPSRSSKKPAKDEDEDEEEEEEEIKPATKKGGKSSTRSK